MRSGDRFNAVRCEAHHRDGAILEGHAEAAFATDTAPITLVDGEMRIDLLIEHGIGVKKNKIEVLFVDAAALADLELEA